MNNMEMRLRRVESVTASLRDDMDDVLMTTYNKAVEDQNEEVAAAMARKIRNHLLTMSDKECAIDRLLPEAPSGSTFTAWLGWLKDLASVATNDWSKYRQQLRDLTEQEGFPFNIEWPVAPDKMPQEDNA